MIDGDVKAIGTDTFYIVTTTLPDVVGLSKGCQASCRSGDGVIFVGFFSFKGDEDQRPAVGLEDTGEFANGFAIVRDMLQNVAAEDDIEGVVRELDIGDVDFEVGGVEEIGAGIAGCKEFAKAGFEGFLGGEMQHGFGLLVEEVGFALEEEPDEAVAFAGIAPRAEDVASGFAGDGDEGARGASTNGAFFLEAEVID